MGVGVNFSICPLNTSKKVDISHCSGVTKKSGFSKSLPQLDLSVAQTPLTFNLISFLFHTVLEFFDKRYALLRKSLRRRQTFFEDIRSLTRYWCFDGWDDLLCFMLRGLKLPDPGG